jgi:hypothetical protein
MTQSKSRRRYSIEHSRSRDDHILSGYGRLALVETLCLHLDHMDPHAYTKPPMEMSIMFMKAPTLDPLIRFITLSPPEGANILAETES